MVKILRSKTVDSNGVEEHRWHYDKKSVNGIIENLKLYIFTFYATHLLFHGLIYPIPIIILYSFNLISTTFLTLITIAYFTSYFIYKPQVCLNKHKLPWYPKCWRLAQFWIWPKFYNDWLEIRRGPASLYENKQFIYAIQPHAILVINRLFMCAHLWSTEIQPHTPSGRFVAATPQFYIPGSRETIIFGGTVEATKRVCHKVLRYL